MPKEKLTPEGEVIAAYGAAMVAAFQVLTNCLEESDALLPGQFLDALRVYACCAPRHSYGNTRLSRVPFGPLNSQDLP
jgi:hypothetical protein